MGVVWLLEAGFGCWDKLCSLITHMLSPFAPQGSRATRAEKHNRKSVTDPDIFLVDIQARPDVLPLPPGPLYSLFITLPLLLIFIFLSLLLAPLLIPSPLLLRLCHWVIQPAESWRQLFKSAPYVLFPDLVSFSNQPWPPGQSLCSQMGLTGCQSSVCVLNYLSSPHNLMLPNIWVSKEEKKKQS